jgi:hypothetical protein
MSLASTRAALAASDPKPQKKPSVYALRIRELEKQLHVLTRDNAELTRQRDEYLELLIFLSKSMRY